MRFNSDTPFKTPAGSPAPLRVTVTRKVRFGECDPMGIVWHGNYAIYAEEAREALAEACGFPYSVLKECEVAFPLKTLFFDYRGPLRYGQSYAVSAVMHWAEAARVNIEYLIAEEPDNEDANKTSLCTKGFSVQLMTDFSGGLLLDWPPFYRNFARRWQQGELSFLQHSTPGDARTA